MAVFPTYPATSFEQGVDLTIFSSNQLGDVINGDATDEIETVNGLVPSLRKALVDNFYFKTPVDWVAGDSETVFNQLRYFSNGTLSGFYYAPRATTTNPVTMGVTPANDANWRLYQLEQQQLPSEVVPWTYTGGTGEETVITPPYIFDSAIVTISGIVQVQGTGFTIQDSSIILSEPLGVDPVTGQSNVLFAYLGKVTATNNDYVQKAVLAGQSGSSNVGYYSTTVQSAIDNIWVTTSSRGIRATDNSSDNTVAMQNLINSTRNIIIDTRVNITGTLTINNPYTTLKGSRGGSIQVFGTAMATASMINIMPTAMYTKIEGLVIDNPTMLKSQTGGRQAAIEIRANYCWVDGCYIWRCLQGVFSRSTEGAYGTKVTNNWFLEMLGAGDGPTNTTSSYGEDRGDAVTIWGAGSIIIGNHAYLMAGQDGRVAFHAESLPNTPATGFGDPNFNHKDVIFTGNIAYGTYRRHFVIEGLSNCSIVNNISMGGASWWAEAYIQCRNVYANNLIYYTRTSADQSGQSWGPIRGASSFVNYNTGVVVESTIYMAPNSSGYGLVIGTQTGVHNIKFTGNILNEGEAANRGVYWLRPTIGIIDGATITGFTNAVQIIAAANCLYKITNCHLSSTSDTIYNNSGNSGDLIVKNNYIETISGTPINIANLTRSELSANTVKALASTYFCNVYGTGVYNTAIMGNNNTGINRLSIRINLSEGFTMRIADDIVIGDNSGITSNHTYSTACLSDAGSVLNLKNRSANMLVTVPGTTRQTYLSQHSGATNTWICLTGGANITPTVSTT